MPLKSRQRQRRRRRRRQSKKQLIIPYATIAFVFRERERGREQGKDGPLKQLKSPCMQLPAAGGRERERDFSAFFGCCPAGEINYYLLRSLGLNGGNDVHHAQTMAAHFRPLNRKRKAKHLRPDNLFVLPLPLLGPFLMVQPVHIMWP